MNNAFSRGVRPVGTRDENEPGSCMRPVSALTATVDYLEPGIDKTFAHEILGSSRFTQVDLAALTPS